MKKTTILLADDHAIVRDGLKAVLAIRKDFAVVGEAEDGAAAVEMAVRLKPDVVVMDLLMPVVNGAAATEALREKVPSAKVLILTSFPDSPEVAAALRNGALGALSKNASKDELFAAIGKIALGERCVSDEIARTVVETEETPSLSPRQREILGLLVKGLNNVEIARQCGLSRAGVKFHLLSVFQILGAASRSEAVAIALKRHLIDG